MTIFHFQIFLHAEVRVEHLPDILLHCLLFHKKCCWTVTMNKTLPVKFSGVSPNLYRKLSLFTELQRIESWANKTFHLKSIGSPSILSKFLQFWEDLIHPYLCSHGQGTIQNLKKRRQSCAEDWWFFRHQLINDRNLSFCSDSNLEDVNIGLCSQCSDNCSRNSFPWILLIPSYYHRHSPCQTSFDDWFYVRVHVLCH